VRRMQFESANRGNVTMQIWLGKQYLGQSDHVVQEIRRINSMDDLSEEELNILIAGGGNVTAEYGVPTRGNTHPALPPASAQTIDLKPTQDKAVAVTQLSVEPREYEGLD
jgi:hypothetical protein